MSLNLLSFSLSVKLGLHLYVHSLNLLSCPCQFKLGLHLYVRSFHPSQDDEEEETPGYKAPAKVDLATIQQLDADDEALVKYKQALLGKTENVLGVCVCVCVCVCVSRVRENETY